MKKGHNPNYEQKKLLVANNLNWKEWLIITTYADRYEFRHKQTNEVKVINIPKKSR